MAEVTDFFQDLTIPYTASRIVRIAQNIEFNLLLHNIFFQLIKINLKKSVFFDQRIFDQFSTIELNASCKRRIDRCID